jgi:hypothetical protein
MIENKKKTKNYLERDKADRTENKKKKIAEEKTSFGTRVTCNIEISVKFNL